MWFFCKTACKDGSAKYRFLRAASRFECLRTLLSNRTVPMYIGALPNVSLRSERPPNRRQWHVFFDALYTALSRKASMVSAFKALQTKSLSPMQKTLATTAIERLQHGNYVWMLFQPFAPILGNGVITLLRLAETGGYFAEGIGRIRTLLALQTNLHRKLKRALVYPACLLGIAVLFILIVSFFLLPQLQSFLSQPSVEADAFTRLLFRLNADAPTVVLGLLALLIPTAVWFKCKKHLSVASLLNLIGRQWLTYGSFTGNLSALLNQRLPLLQALKLTFADVPIKNLMFETVRERLQKGQTLAKAVNGLPKELQRAIETAEARGDLPSVLQEYSRDCYQRYEECLLQVLKWTEPLCIIAIVGLVLLTIALMVQPLSQVFRFVDWDSFR
jgi:type II secretory pathway component PulF